jgi:uncharacterized protein YgiM (DUF1202 family)
MKKIISFILAVIFTGILLLPVNTSAANISMKAGYVRISDGLLNVRSSESTSSAVISSLKKNTYVTLMSIDGNWWHVEYEKGRFGYCHKDYITEKSSQTAQVAINSGYLNVRNGTFLSNSVIARLYKNETVIILSSTGDWSRILFNGTKTGYVKSDYLRLNSSDSGYNQILLNVPDYKQTDSRWRNVIIGNSGKTIGSIGCVTTGIAMMQSYRTGTTIYPDAMSRKLSYSSSGNVYWPSDYIVTTSSTGYLAKIYDILKTGKPVLFGAKNSQGGQHWVVIKGFRGGNLTASNFIINDPATVSRTTLQQFLNAYPNFYKFFRY